MMEQNIPSSSTSNQCSRQDEENDDETIKEFGISDEVFKNQLINEVENVPGRKEYSLIFDKSIDAMVQWRKRYRGNPTLWKRLFKKDRVIKELIEAAPIIQAVMEYVSSFNSEEENGERITIMDLCSGKGYLSMFLSELLPPEKINRIILIDKAWAMCNTKELLPHHMNWDHIYGTIPSQSMIDDNYDSNNEESERPETYFTSWPITLHTSKQDLKQSCNQRQMKKHFFDRIDGPIVILAIHLCGTLSLKAIDMFNNNENVSFFALKPCCLPNIIHAKRDETFTIGSHEFPAKDVCSHGRFKKNLWKGPPRWFLKEKFDTWAENLYLGIDTIDHESIKSSQSNEVEMPIPDDKGRKVKQNIDIQVDGGYQNTYVFAQRNRLTTKIWK